MTNNINTTLRNILWRAYVTLSKFNTQTCCKLQSKCLKMILWLHKVEDKTEATE